MSNYSNDRFMIGFRTDRGWTDADVAGVAGGTGGYRFYSGAVPVADVAEHLFGWDAVEGQLTATALTPDGVLTHTDTTRKAVMRSDSGAVLGVFKSGYRIHQYRETLLDNLSRIIDSDLSIGSAVSIKDGAVAAVTIETPENMTTAEGVDFRPYILAASSHDGSVANMYKPSMILPICRNTTAAAINAKSAQVYKIKHTRYSALKLQDARDALGLIFTMAEDFSAQVGALCATTVTDSDWRKFLDSLTPVPEEDGRAKTMAQGKRDTLQRLYDHDNRVAPWKGTAFGVLQAVNTYEHHEAQVRGMERDERNMLRTIKGEMDALDVSTLDRLALVLA